MIFGVVAASYPIVSTYAVLVILAVIFIIAGLISIFGSVYSGDPQGYLYFIMIGILYLVFAYIMLAYPEEGILTITLLLSALLLIGGLIKVVYAFKLRPHSVWWFVLLSGVISLLLCLFIYIGYPLTSMFVLGIIVGLYFLLNGVSLILFSLWLSDKAKTV